MSPSQGSRLSVAPTEIRAVGTMVPDALTSSAWRDRSDSDQAITLGEAVENSRAAAESLGTWISVAHCPAEIVTVAASG